MLKLDSYGAADAVLHVGSPQLHMGHTALYVSTVKLSKNVLLLVEVLSKTPTRY